MKPAAVVATRPALAVTVRGWMDIIADGVQGGRNINYPRTRFCRI